MSENIYSLEIFKWIERETVDKIVAWCSEKVFEYWEIIISEWEESNWEWYIIKDWSVSVSISWQKIAELASGNIFWEIALLNEESRTATVTANKDTQVIVLKLNDLIDMINNDDNSINKEIIRRIEENLNYM